MAYQLSGVGRGVAHAVASELSQGFGRGYHGFGRGFDQGCGREFYRGYGRGFDRGYDRGIDRGAVRGFGRGRGSNQEAESLRKRKSDILTDMFEKKARIESDWNATGTELACTAAHHLTSHEDQSGSSRHGSQGDRWNQLQSSYRRLAGPSPSVRGRPWEERIPRGRRPNQWKGNRYTSANLTVEREKCFHGNEARDNHSLSESGKTIGSGNRADSRAIFYLSKTMARLLRHGADEAELLIQPDGYVLVKDLLQYRGLGHQFTQDDVTYVVNSNDKQRFQLKVDQGTNELMVRATQGHTIKVPDLELKEITDASEAPVVVHGTYMKILPKIKKQGLSRMSRNHIHFAAGEPGNEGVISGMRQSCQVLIYINLKKALDGGIRFFRSSNNVILSPGDKNGFISPEYFDRVEERFKARKTTDRK